METFRLLHISDLHFSDKNIGWKNEISSASDIVKREVLSQLFSGKNIFRPSTFDKDIALAANEYILEHIYRSDALVITGDLATTGSEFDLLVARNFLLGDIPRKWEVEGFFNRSLIGDHINTIIIPGNHDRYHTSPTTWLHPGCKKYEQIFGDDWSLTSYQPTLKVHDLSNAHGIKLVHLAKGRESLLIFCVDLSLKSCGDSDSRLNLGYIGQGKAYRSAIKRLKEYTNLCRLCRSNMEIIWCTHFPPSNPANHGHENPKLRLLDEERLVLAANECKVPVILAGHAHRQQNYQLTDNGYTMNIFCAGTTCSVDSDVDGNRFWELEFDIDNGEIGRFATRQIKYDEDADCFLEVV